MKQQSQSKSGNYRSILCAVDFSLQATAALQLAVEIVRHSGGHLTALCVEDPVLSLGAAAAGYNSTLIRKATLRQLEKLVERVAGPAGLPANAWSAEALVGKPAVAIAKFARELNADLIVMGTNGRRGPAKLFFGSVAEAVLRRTPSPLLVVPRSRPGPPLRLHARPILGAIELGPNDVGDARRIADAARRLGGPLTLLHVVRPVPELPGITPELDRQGQLRAARKLLNPIARRVQAASAVASGHPEDEISAAAREMKAGLIVLALRRGRGLFGPRQGTTTYRLLSTTATPVLALPPVASR